jgi:hypothetical protein
LELDEFEVSACCAVMAGASDGVVRVVVEALAAEASAVDGVVESG